MNTSISKYLASIGSKGGKAGRGEAKARSSEQARKAGIASAKRRAELRAENETKRNGISD